MFAELREQREKLNEAIIVMECISLGHGKRRGRPPAWMAALERRGRPPGSKNKEKGPGER